MRSKRINKKLSLNKETVANLHSDEMNAVQGGTGISGAPCVSVIIPCTETFHTCLSGCVCFETDNCA